MLQILTELKGLNLTDTVKACPLLAWLFVAAEIGPINLLLKNWPSSCQKAAIKKSQTEAIYSIPRNPMNSRKPSRSLLLGFKMKRLTFRTVILNIYKVIFKTFLRETSKKPYKGEYGRQAEFFRASERSSID